MITAYINYAELPSWLCLAPLRSLIDATGAAVELKPLLSSLGNVAGSNLNAGESDPLVAYRARRANARHRAASRENERMCELLGITPDKGERKIDPLYLSLGLRWLDQQDAGLSRNFDYTEAAFVKTFRDAAEVESAAGLKTVLASIGFDTDGLDQFMESERVVLETSREEILESGVFNAPAFVVDGEIFHGREHLPLIRWMLTGKPGVPPV